MIYLPIGISQNQIKNQVIVSLSFKAIAGPNVNTSISFRHIKTTLGMDILRCKTPEMVIKEIIMHLIVYNTLRQLMFESTNQAGVPQKTLAND